jgi:uncharacterized protein (TIGR00645 family)
LHEENAMEENDVIPIEKNKINKKYIEQNFEQVLWGTRYVILLPVIFSLIGSLIMFIIGSIDVIKVIIETVQYFYNVRNEIDIHSMVIVKIVGAIDIYLIAVVLLIFSFGLYTLFISKIDIAEQSESSKLLDVHSLDSLKDKLSQVIIMALIVKFFQMIFTMDEAYKTSIDMIYLSVSILALGICLFFVYRAKAHKSEIHK